MEKCVILYQGCLCINGNCQGREAGKAQPCPVCWVCVSVPEGGFWFDFVNFDFTARARGEAQTELPSLAEGATNPRLESSPGFSEETMQLQSHEDSTATQSYLSTGDFFFF